MEDRNNVVRMANEHAANYAARQTDPANPDSTSAGRGVGELKLMADILDDIQSNLEPIRDRALDERARLTGYSQCAEAMIKIIADRAAAYKKQAIDLARRQHEERQQEQAAAAAAPEKKKSNGVSKTSNGASKKASRRKAAKKEEQSLGDDSVADQRGSA